MPKPAKEMPPSEEEFDENLAMFMEGEEGEKESPIDEVIAQGLHFSVPFSFKLSKERPSVFLPLEPNAMTTITGISLSASNSSSEKHIIELCHGAKRLDFKTVIARILPGVVETISPNISLSAHAGQAELNLLAGDGPVDITGVIEMDLSKDREVREYMDEKDMGSFGNDGNTKTCCDSGNSQMDKEAMRAHIKKQLMDNAFEEPKRKSDVSVSFEAKAKSGDAPKKESAKEEKSKQGEKADRTFREVRGVKICDIKEGSGPALVQGKKASVSYVLRLNNETGKIIDKTDENRKFKFRLGEGSVIAGWEIGASGMKVGGKRVLIIPPHLGYGKKGSPPEIPPNSTLYFEIQLHGIN